MPSKSQERRHTITLNFQPRWSSSLGGMSNPSPINQNTFSFHLFPFPNQLVTGLVMLQPIFGLSYPVFLQSSGIGWFVCCFWFGERNSYPWQFSTLKLITLSYLDLLNITQIIEQTCNFRKFSHWAADCYVDKVVNSDVFFQSHSFQR